MWPRAVVLPCSGVFTALCTLQLVNVRQPLCSFSLNDVAGKDNHTSERSPKFDLFFVRY